jgi:hypothetical protein
MKRRRMFTAMVFGGFLLSGLTGTVMGTERSGSLQTVEGEPVFGQTGFTGEHDVKVE